MKVLFFILFAGYAVRCDENNYYVIEMLEDTTLRQQKPFKIYWNVPTMQCKSKKIPFENLYEKFGIIQNENDSFMGDKVTILYDPGLFPALLKNETSGRFKFRNGGVPQEGDLYKHLEEFKKVLDQSIPVKTFDGVAVIDFESWRPVYRQNFGVLRPYKDVSLEIERKLHWWWQKQWLQDEAKMRFEEAARTFMQKTIALAKQLRPHALWGFYGFPYCFNMASNNMVEGCASGVPHENDNISWLWRESTALFPSVYSSVGLAPAQLRALVRGRVREASRFARPVLPYFWYRYRDAGFLTQGDLEIALDTLYKSNASGFIIWGSSSDVNTVPKCTKLLNYIEQVMGPAIAKYTQSRRLQNIDDINNNTSTDGTVAIVNNDTTNVSSDVTTNIPTKSTEVNINTNRIKDLDPEYHWIPPENYTQTIKDHVAEEINKKLSNHTRNEEAVLDNNVLIDLILNSVNTSVSDKEHSTISSVDSSSTTRKEENSYINSGESLSTTETTTATLVETSTVTNEIVTNDNIVKTHLELDLISSTEGTKSSDMTTFGDSYKFTSQTNDKMTEEYLSTSTAPDKFTVGTLIDKNQKKIDSQGSIKGFYDITTKTPLSTETTELNIPKLDIIENNLAVSGFTTDTSPYTEDDYATEINKNINIETTTKEFHEVLNFKIDDIDIYTTETLNSSPTTTVKTNDKTETDSSTTEPGISVATGQNTIKYFDHKENNGTEQPDLKKYTKTIDNLSTKASNLLEHTEDRNAKNLEEEEETSLVSSSASPQQVSGSASRITKSQTLYCIIFYMYSVAKCLCSIFKQCS